LIILCALVFYVAKHLIAAWRLRRSCSFAIRELDKCLAHYQEAVKGLPAEQADAVKLNFVNELNAVLRRVALKHFPAEPLASLSGPDWIAFLRGHGDASLLDDKLASTLSQGRFAKQWEVDDKGLYRMAHHWISSLYLAKIAAKTQSTEPTTPVSKHA
tara:strand:- start:209 stop:682 length:474 start_codon:yes stop_codon:yes gene_type:complete